MNFVLLRYNFMVYNIEIGIKIAIQQVYKGPKEWKMLMLVLSRTRNKNADIY